MNSNRHPVCLIFGVSGFVPNHPTFPVLVYPAALELAGRSDPASLIERTFAKNGWTDSWRNGIFGYTHFHSAIHEVLGVAQGRARVRLGGESGESLDIGPGDVIVLPAGTGHQRLLATQDFVVVGAYPSEGEYDLCRATREGFARAQHRVGRAAAPKSDPVHGASGPLVSLWDQAPLT